MKYIRILFLFVCIHLTTSCADYLDVMPDELLTMEHIFVNRVQSEKFLFTCYSYMPKLADPWNSPMILGEDEYWWDRDVASFEGRPSIRIALGYQNADNPVLNFWNGEVFRYASDQKSLFIALRDCNIFLENIHLPTDIQEAERAKWIAEVKFLKAYYHFFLMQLYGPIPIIKENLSTSATPDEARVYREPVEDVVAYIVQLINEAVPDLPLSTFETGGIEAGRITQPIALALKAQALVWLASPLFNGNKDYADFKDNKGRLLIPAGDPDLNKWKAAAVAIEAAIDTCHLAGHQLYKYRSFVGGGTTDSIALIKRSIRGAVTEKFNEELVWPATINEGDLHSYVVPILYDIDPVTCFATNEIHATLAIAEQFYTHNGIPLEEDTEWLNWIGGSFADRYGVQRLEGMGIDGITSMYDDHKYYIQQGETTAKLHFYREPRFYASMGFDRGIWEANLHGDNDFYLKARDKEPQGRISSDRHSCTGYFVKKMINMASSRTGDIFTPTRYSFPLIRLSDLYLLYAEALNEANGPSSNAYLYIDKVRERAGLKGVVESWKKSSNPSKPASKEGLREIIKQERLIELSFEGHRFWDLRLWKEAMKYMNRPVQGWDYTKNSIEEFYQINTIQQANKRAFALKDYLWPIKVHDLQVNANLVQNPGWPTGLKHNEQYK